MKHYIRLSNAPIDFLNACKKLYEEKFCNYNFDIKMSKFHYSTDLSNEDHNYLNKYLPEPSSDSSWNLITNAGPPHPAHIDRGRKAALQVPIVANSSDHFCYVLKDESFFDALTPQESSGFMNKLDTKWLNERYPGMPMFYKFEEQYFDINNIKAYEPYINDTSIPHGGIHTKEHSNRFFFSISIPAKKEIQELKGIFSKWIGKD